MTTASLVYTTPISDNYQSGFVKVNSSQLTDLNINSIRGAKDVDSWLEVFQIVKNLGVTTIDFMFEPTTYQVKAAQAVFTGLNELIMINGSITA